ncbi:hypothetical protein NUTIK01_09840 [Novosphingobium sp. IK01]|uniref:Uncharacterized protein n=1 Tax=Novosphingobium pituita TaxID=3056842 RepID=A0ABQ6P761_9SPHN|nr:hypothetical protein NUTIK01_09840 [Novosphingobium sp. IK01]
MRAGAAGSPLRARLQPGAFEFHWGKPPPAAAPRTMAYKGLVSSQKGGSVQRKSPACDGLTLWSAGRQARRPGLNRADLHVLFTQARADMQVCMAAQALITAQA